MRPTSFLTLEPGTPVVDRFGHAVGEVDRVLVLETRRISLGAVTLGVTVPDVVNPGPNARRIYGMPELAERVGIAHVAETLDELDAALEDVSIS